MEKVATTIPHLFYDLLARIIPGTIFLSLAIVQGFQYALFGSVREVGSSNFMATFLNGLIFAAAAYFSGWMLSVFSVSRISGYFGKEDKGKKLRHEYYKVKLKSERAGFPILKLRAEVRMLEAIQVAFSILIILNLSRSFFPKLFGDEVTSGELNLASLATLVLGVIGTQLAIKPTWDRYHSAIETHHGLIFKQGLLGISSSDQQSGEVMELNGRAADIDYAKSIQPEMAGGDAAEATDSGSET